MYKLTRNVADDVGQEVPLSLDRSVNWYNFREQFGTLS